MGFHNHVFHRFRNAAEDAGGYHFGLCGCPPTAGSQSPLSRRVCQVMLLGVEVCREEVVVMAALCAIAEPAAIQFGLQVNRPGSARRLLPGTPDFLLQPPVIADNLHCSRKVHRAVQMGVGREVLWEEDSTHAEIKGEATHIALAMHLLVELMTERGTDVLDARERKLPVSVEGDRMGVVVVSSPIDDGCALTALEVRVMHTI